MCAWNLKSLTSVSRAMSVPEDAGFDMKILGLTRNTCKQWA